jgi:hypothetical protein
MSTNVLHSSVETAHNAVHSTDTNEQATAHLAQLIAHHASQLPSSSSSSSTPSSQHWLNVLVTLLRCAPSHRLCADASLRIVRELCDVHATAFLASALTVDRSIRVADTIWHAVRELALTAAVDADIPVRVGAAALLGALAGLLDSHKAVRLLCDLAMRDPSALCREAALAAMPLVRADGSLACAVRVACSDQHSSVRAVLYSRLTLDATSAAGGDGAEFAPLLRALTVDERRALLDSGLRNRSDPVYSECESMIQAWAMCDFERGVRESAPSVLVALRLLGSLSECERLALKVVDTLFAALQVVPLFHAAPFGAEEVLVWRHACAALNSDKHAVHRETIAKMFRFPSIDVIATMLEPWASGTQLADLFVLRQLLGCVAPLVALGRARVTNVVNDDGDDSNSDDDGNVGGDESNAAKSTLSRQLFQRQGEEACRRAVLRIVKRPQLYDACEEALVALWSFDETVDQRLHSLVDLIGHLIDDDEPHDECCGSSLQRWLTACQASLFCMRHCDRRRAITDSLLKVALSAIKHSAPELRLKGAELLPHFHRIGTAPYEFVAPPLQLVALSVQDVDSVRAKALEGLAGIYAATSHQQHRASLPFGGEHQSGDDLLADDASVFDTKRLQYRSVRAQTCTGLLHSVLSGAAVGIQSVLGALVCDVVVDVDGSSKTALKFALYSALVAWPHRDDISRNAVLLLALFDADVQDQQRGADMQRMLRAWVNDRAQASRIVADSALLLAVARVLRRSQCFLDRSELLNVAPQASNVEQLLGHLQFVTERAHSATLWLGLAERIKSMASDDVLLTRTMLRCIDITAPQHDESPQSRERWLAPFLRCIDDVGDAELQAYVRALQRDALDVSFAAWRDSTSKSRKRRGLTDALRMKRVSFGEQRISPPLSPDVFSAPSGVLSELTLSTASTTSLRPPPPMSLASTLDFDENAIIVPDTPPSAVLQSAQQVDVVPLSSSLSSASARRQSSRGSLLPTAIVPATIDVSDDDVVDDDNVVVDDDEPSPRPLMRASRESDTLPPTQVVPPTAVVELDDDEDEIVEPDPVLIVVEDVASPPQPRPTSPTVFGASASPAMASAAPHTASPIATQPHALLTRGPFRQIRAAIDAADSVRFDDLFLSNRQSSNAPAAASGAIDSNGNDNDVATTTTTTTTDEVPSDQFARRPTTVSYKRRAAGPQPPTKRASNASALIYITPSAMRERASDAPSLDDMARVLNVHFLPASKRSRATHVIVPSGNNRTLFTLCAALRHMWLVPARWLTQSFQANALLPERFFGSRLTADPLAKRRVWCDPAMLAVGAKHGFPASHFETLVQCGGGTMARAAASADLVLVLEIEKIDDDSLSSAMENRHVNRGGRRKVPPTRMAVGALFDTLQPLPSNDVESE